MTDACPTLEIDYAVATPYAAKVGASLQVYSHAVDTNRALPISYRWSVASPIGNFVPTNSADATFNCTASGDSVRVLITAGNGICTKTLSTIVSCSPAECGDGALDPGEACDPSVPPQNPLCLPNCTLADCGNNIVELPVETCDPPNGTTCSSLCQVLFSCGDNIVAPGEECDPPGSPTPLGICGPTCQSVPLSHCGNGILEFPETCEAPNTTTTIYATPNCGGVWGPTTAPAAGGIANDCSPITSSTCQNCGATMVEDCASLAAGCNVLGTTAETGPGLAPLGTPRAWLCNEVLDCIRDTGCAIINPLDCYCGNATADQCLQGQGNGVCRHVIERGLETPLFADIEARFQNATFGGGWAIARVNCEQAFCPTQCFP